MREINKKDKAEEYEQSGANHGNVVAPEDEKAVRYEERDDDKHQPEQNFGAPPTVDGNSAGREEVKQLPHTHFEWQLSCLSCPLPQ